MARAMAGMSSPARPSGYPSPSQRSWWWRTPVHERLVEQRPDDLGAEDGVLPHQLPLVPVEPARLEQHPVRHADLADVVQVRRLLHIAGAARPTSRARVPSSTM